jgi:hypothetical protein
MFVIPTSLIIMLIFFLRAKSNWYKYREEPLKRCTHTGIWWLGIAAFSGLIVLSAMSPRF